MKAFSKIKALKRSLTASIIVLKKFKFLII